MPQLPAYVYALAAAVVSFWAGWLSRRWAGARRHGQARQLRERLLDDARKEAADIVKTAEIAAKEEFFAARQRFEEETERSRQENRRRQETIDQRQHVGTTAWPDAQAQPIGALQFHPWRACLDIPSLLHNRRLDLDKCRRRVLAPPPLAGADNPSAFVEVRAA